MLVPIINIYVHNTIYYTSYLGFCPWHLSLKPAGPWDFPFRIVSIIVFHPFSWPLNLLLVVCGEVKDTVRDSPLATTQDYGGSFSRWENYLIFWLVETHSHSW